MSSEQSGSRGEGVQGYAGAGRWNGGGGFVKLMHTLRFCSCDMSNALYLTPGLAEILERRGFVGCHRRFPLFFTPIPSPSPPPSTHTHTLTNTQTHTQTHTHSLSLSAKALAYPPAMSKSLRDACTSGLSFDLLHRYTTSAMPAWTHRE